eukprot:TRINITY_DN1684_c0_g1_i1.p1 TRINITY_DN1684_c0_g1~~TRINITY_DN1684_c0_g1_i1.p1  ORF type:complete len:338 (+),score=169.46 TRINITY_DN1684_c0_g1_i1:347-1360(+)
MDTTTVVNTTLPAALAELMKSHENIKQIAAYCKSAYLQDPKVYEQTQNYTKDALENVAYHVQTIGTHFVTLLDLQSNEIDKLDIQLRSLSDKVKCTYDAAGSTAFKGPADAKVYSKSIKARKLDATQMPSQPIRKYTRTPMNYASIDAGTATSTSVSGERSSFYSARPSVAFTSPPAVGSPSAPPPSFAAPPSLSAPSFSSPPPPPSMGAPPPPPSMGAPPPPPSMGAPPPPPSMGAPPPPPSMGAPPPPPSMGAPPPPPSMGAPPPPPSMGAPPPPPSMGAPPPPPSFGGPPPPPPFGAPPPPPAFGDLPPPPPSFGDLPPPPPSFGDLPPPPPPF